MELKTARLTVLLDPTRKQAFERVCRENDMTPSQVLRRLIRDYMDSAAQATRLLPPGPIVTRPSAKRTARAAPAPARAAKARRPSVR